MVMSNMNKSPAAQAMNQLIAILLDDGTSVSPSDALSDDHILQCAMFLHEGGLAWVTRATHIHLLFLVPCI